MKRTTSPHPTSALALCAVAAVLALAAPARGAPPTSAPVDTSRVHLGPADAGTGAFVAWPPGKGAAPAVIVIHEWWGLNGQIREVAHRLARQGYVAIVPDLYHGKVADDPELAHTLSRGLDEDQALADLGEALRWLRAERRTAKGKAGVVGFCMGGRLSELFALSEPGMAAAVMFYGRPDVNPQKLAALRVPLQGHFGAEDQGITPESVAAFRTALKTAGKNSEIFIYAGAGHAFMTEGRKSYHADSARQAWERTLAFFKKNLR
jgi:carboxymethylenebutenolidase